MKSEKKSFYTLISSSKSHAAAVGAFGHLYVWGRNTLDRDISFESNQDSELESEMNQEIYYNQLGFGDTDIRLLKEPIYFPLIHPLYNVTVTQVSCGSRFTAVVAKEKENPHSQLKFNNDPELFNLEVDDRIANFPPKNLTHEQLKHFDDVILSNRIRSSIAEHLKSTKQVALKKDNKESHNSPRHRGLGG